jgi:2-polyprenyl-3-methyl-5-hydroxy-6-metoxy-1,4-benzoquinol methylase
MEYVYSDAVRQDILRMIPDDGKVIGSIGCGPAGTEAVLAQRGYEVHGVDVAPEAIEIAKPRLASARLISPADREPFSPNSLDGLILADVIEHIPQAWDALRSFVKAVRPGGWVVISVPNMRNIECMFEFLVRADWPERPVGIFDATHLQVMTKKRLARWCEAAGIPIEKWFDRYDPNGPRRYRFFRTLDLVTLKLIHSWCMYQLQVRCRKPAAAAGG